ncbi:MAG: hypothetical protein LQ342_000054 [Letrouitia transgressa]|nr:MAG: hypothetical protein LQ342_000054 [Letrouitia transgressa]
MAFPTQLDTIYLRNLHLSAVIGPDAWGREDKIQPVVLNVRLKIDTTTASTSDDISHTFSYGQMCKEITSQLDGKAFNSLQHLITVLTTFAAFWPGEDTRLQAMAPKALLRVDGGLELSHTIRKKERYEEEGVPQVRHVDTRSWSIKGLKVGCIIGVNPHERLQKQGVNIDLRIPAIDPRTFDAPNGASENWRTLVKRVCEVVEYSSFETLEALAALIAKTALEGFPVQEITVSVEKPSALTFVEGAGVEITRRKDQYLIRADSSGQSSEASRPRMTLDQYNRMQKSRDGTPQEKPSQYPPMHAAPTLEQYRDMKQKSEGPERYSDNGTATPQTLPLPQSPAQPALPRTRTMSPSSTKTKPTRRPSDSAASYRTDGLYDIFPEPSPTQSRDFATNVKSPRVTSPAATNPKSQQSFFDDDRYDSEKSTGPFPDSDIAASRQSGSSSMFGASPSKRIYLDGIQPPFSVDGGTTDSAPAMEDIRLIRSMPGSFQETPGVSKEALPIPIPKHANGQQDEITEIGSGRKSGVKYGEAF